MLLMTEQETPQWLTPAQVAEILQVHPDTVLRWVREKKLKGTKAGRQVRIRKSEVDAFLERGEEQ